LNGLEHGTAGGTTIFENYTWTSDADNRVSSVANADHTSENVGTYTYDGNGELTAAAPPSGISANAANTLSNSYDANGNPNSSGDVIGAGNRLLSDGTYNYVYDASGEMVSQIDISTGAEIDYAYDTAGRTTGITDKDSSGRTTDAIDFTLDVYGQLIGRGESVYTYTGDSDTPSSTTSTVTTFVHDAVGNIVLQFDGTGALTERDLWGPGVNQILAEEQFSPTTAGEMPTSPGNVYWTLPNDQGSVADLLASDGTLENHTAYSAFGAAVSSLSTKAVDSFFGAYGEFTDSTTGDLITDARIDKVSIERWTRTDPTGVQAGDPNFYRDRGNDPVNLIDPSGLEGECPPISFSGPVPGIAPFMVPYVAPPLRDHGPSIGPISPAEAELLHHNHLILRANDPSNNWDQTQEALIALNHEYGRAHFDFNDLMMMIAAFRGMPAVGPNSGMPQMDAGEFLPGQYPSAFGGFGSVRNQYEGSGEGPDSGGFCGAGNPLTNQGGKAATRPVSPKTGAPIPNPVESPVPSQVLSDATIAAENINNGTKPSGWSGKWGDPHKNFEGNLPQVDAEGNPITYSEHYLPKDLGDQSTWGANRLVVGSDGNAYVTTTHYGQSGSPPFVYVGSIR